MKKSSKKDEDIKESENSEESEDNEEEDEDSEESGEELENIVNSSFSGLSYPRKIINANPSMEINEDNRELEAELRNIPVRSEVSETSSQQSSSYSLSTNYMSGSYQPANYESSVYPKMISPRENVNPFLDSGFQAFQQNESLRGQNFLKSSSELSSGEYPKAEEVKKYQPVSEQKRDKKRF